MGTLYRKAVQAWGAAMPPQLKNLRIRTDDIVYDALLAVLNDITSPNWTADSRIAWALMQGRAV